MGRRMAAEQDRVACGNHGATEQQPVSPQSTEGTSASVSSVHRRRSTMRSTTVITTAPSAAIREYRDVNVSIAAPGGVQPSPEGCSRNYGFGWIIFAVLLPGRPEGGWRQPSGPWPQPGSDSPVNCAAGGSVQTSLHEFASLTAAATLSNVCRSSMFALLFRGNAPGCFDRPRSRSGPCLSACGVIELSYSTGTPRYFAHAS